MRGIRRRAAAAAAAAISVRSATTGSDTGVSVSSVALPSSYVAGDLLLLFVALQAGSNRTLSTPAGWSVLFDVAQTSDSLRRFTCFYKTASGGEGSTVSITASGSSEWVSHAYAVTNWQGTPEAVSIVQADQQNTTTPDPPSLTPSWGAGSASLLITLACHQNAVTLTSYPTNYTTNGITQVISTVLRMSSSYRIATVASEDPGVFTIGSTARGYVETVAVRNI